MSDDILEWFYPTWIGGRVANMLANRVLAGDGFIAMFHDIVPDTNGTGDGQKHIDTHLQVTKSHFAHFIRYLAEKDYHFITLDQLHDHVAGVREAPKPFTVITFDDGYRNVFTQAFPVLFENKVPFTVYPTIDMLEGRSVLWWYLLEDLLNSHEEISFRYAGKEYEYHVNPENKNTVFHSMKHLIRESNGDPSLVDTLFTARGIDPLSYSNLGLTYTDVRAMLASNLVTIGVHTIHHQMLSRLPDDAITREILQAKKTLDETLGIVCRHLSYPYGDLRSVNDRVLRCVEKMPFATAVTTTMGHIVKAPSDQRYLLTLPRIEVLDDDAALPDRRFAAKRSNLLPTVSRLKGLLSSSIRRR